MQLLCNNSDYMIDSSFPLSDRLYYVLGNLLADCSIASNLLQSITSFKFASEIFDNADLIVVRRISKLTQEMYKDST